VNPLGPVFRFPLVARYHYTPDFHLESVSCRSLDDRLASKEIQEMVQMAYAPRLAVLFRACGAVRF
jgi:hypothetical protein